MQPVILSILLSCLLCVSAMANVTAAGTDSANQGTTRSWHMPSSREMIRLAWVQGPPVLQVFHPIDQHLRGFREDDALLGFRGGEWGMLFDPRKMMVERLTAVPAGDLTSELLDLPAMRKRWEAGSLDLWAVSGGKTYRPSGGPIKKDAPDYSPVHIVESGDWFQHVAVYDLVLQDESGERLDAKSWLEIRAWGDRCLFEWFVEPATGTPAELSISLASGRAKQSTKSTGGRVQLGVSFKDGKMSPLPDESRGVKISARSLNDYTRGDPQIRYSEVTDAWEILIPKQDWPVDGALAYNKDLLDRISRFSLALENTSGEARDVRLRFIHDHHPLTGYVPMMLDGMGRQTGLPFQNSKNWHIRKEDRHPYDGEWIHQTTRMRLEPGANVSLEYAMPHALWHGVPLSSAAQLSLIGWGFNGFWVQMALGSWGETLCIQPGRTMRRAFITDIRPFMAMGKASGKPYDWTSNVGGGDIAKLVGADGKLVMWKGAVTDFCMIGPNLSHVRVTERAEDDSIRLVIDTYLPRSSSLARSYFKVRLDVLKDVVFREFTLLQFGSDYYNESNTRTLSWGNAEGRSGNAQPPAGEGGRVGDLIPLAKNTPWIALHGLKPEADKKTEAIRGAIVRNYRAVIGGKPSNELWLAPSRAAKHLAADLILPARMNRFKKGDSIEFLVELTVIPPGADLYYGPDDGLKQRLAASPEIWEEVAREAGKKDTEIDGKSLPFPATLGVTGQARATFNVRSFTRLETVCITGLPDPSMWQIGDLVDDEWRVLGERFPEEAHPQLNYDPIKGNWTAVLSLAFPEGGGDRQFEYRRNQELSPVKSE